MKLQDAHSVVFGAKTRRFLANAASARAHRSVFGAAIIAAITGAITGTTPHCQGKARSWNRSDYQTGC
jgi:hypothetical protein